jgi:thiosulfate/3-mercaptopyruvate sulfurtransferase
MSLFGKEVSSAQISGLVEPEWLLQHAAGVNLFDAGFAMPGSGRNMATEFAAKHIDGAQYFDLEIASDTNNFLPHMLPQPDKFVDYLKHLGFDDRKTTVIHDDGTYVGASRLWWMLRVFGHDNVVLLNGGLPGWEALHLPVTKEIASPKAGRLSSDFRAELVWTQDHVAANLDHGQTILLDARAATRFRGEQAEPRPGVRRGHIPGALNLPWPELIDPATKRFWPMERLREIFIGTSIRLDEPIATTCGSGVSACVLAFGLFLLGRSDIPIYDGSWAEWGREGSNPIMLGAGQRLRNLEASQ